MEKLASVIAVAELALEFVFRILQSAGGAISKKQHRRWPTKKPWIKDSGFRRGFLLFMVATLVI